MLEQLKAYTLEAETATALIEDEETLAQTEMTVYYSAIPEGADKKTTIPMTYQDAVAYLERNGFEAPDPADYGVWVPRRPRADRKRPGCRSAVPIGSEA